MSTRFQAIKVKDPECFYRLPPAVALSLDPDTANSDVDGYTFANFVVDSGSGGNTFLVVEQSDSGYYAEASAAGTNTGDGTLDNPLVVDRLVGVAETWTIACTDDTTEGEEVWSVTGSVSGLQTAEATTGVEYLSDDGSISFTITAGNTAFVAADEFTFDVVKLGSYIKALRPCRLIIEGIGVRGDATDVGGLTATIGTESQNYGQVPSPAFITGTRASVTDTICSTSLVLDLNSGEGLSLRIGSNDVSTLFLVLRVSSFFPE